MKNKNSCMSRLCCLDSHSKQPNRRHAERASRRVLASLCFFSCRHAELDSASRCYKREIPNQVWNDDRVAVWSDVSNNRAFTLIELLVVVLIIGILAAVALPLYQNAVEKARFQELIGVGYALSKAQNLYFMENNSYASSLEDLLFSFKPEPYNEKMTKPTKNSSCTITANGVTSCVTRIKGDLVQVNFSPSGKLISCTAYGSFNGDYLCAALPGARKTWRNGCYDPNNLNNACHSWF